MGALAFFLEEQKLVDLRDDCDLNDGCRPEISHAVWINVSVLYNIDCAGVPVRRNDNASLGIMFSIETGKPNPEDSDASNWACEKDIIEVVILFSDLDKERDCIGVFVGDHLRLRA